MHSIGFSNQAGKELGAIYKRDKKLYLRLITAIEILKTRPYEGKALKGRLLGDYSLRVGNYRVIYTVYKNKLVVYIIDLGHRKDIYK